jgi:hypothetical protein
MCRITSKTTRIVVVVVVHSVSVFLLLNYLHPSTIPIETLGELIIVKISLKSRLSWP